MTTMRWLVLWSALAAGALALGWALVLRSRAAPDPPAPG